MISVYPPHSLGFVHQGVDNKTSTLEWAISKLLSNLAKMTTAHQEFGEAVGEGATSRGSNIPGLPYLQAVVKDAFRMLVQFVLPHKAEANVEVCGFRLLRNARVLISLKVMGLGPERGGLAWIVSCQRDSQGERPISSDGVSSLFRSGPNEGCVQDCR
ncbi:hypothetical protein NL676_009677 [Syzygium grande]|nr:hypothetical protein NL676_009677 [Syzygium grande]